VALFRQVNASQTEEWDTRSEVGESGKDASTVTLTEPSRGDCGDGRRGHDDGSDGDAATRPTVAAGGVHARSACGTHAADAGGVSVLSLSQCDISVDSLYRRSTRTFPDEGGRIAVTMQDECPLSECGSLPKCLQCIDWVPKSRTPVVLTEEEKRILYAKRAAQAVSDIIRASQLRYLLTPTAGKSFTTRKMALDAWSGYLDDTRYGRWFRQVIDGRYLAVAEPYEHEDGWHLHIALDGYIRPPHLMRLKVTWTAYLYHRLGIARPDTEQRLWRVHIAAPGKGRSPKNLGQYLGKYLSKGFGGDSYPGEHRYRCGLGLQRPQVTVTYHLCSDMEARSLLMECGQYYEITTADGKHLGWGGEFSPCTHSPPVP